VRAGRFTVGDTELAMVTVAGPHSVSVICCTVSPSATTPRQQTA
jgi:hypothetical protein